MGMIEKINIYELENTYSNIPYDIMDETNDKYLFTIKVLNDTRIICDADKRIFLLYLACGSSRKSAKHIDLKYRQIAYIVKKVKNKILEEYGKYNN